MQIIFLCCLFCLTSIELFVKCVYGDLYSSIHGLDLLIDNERKCLEALESYLDRESERLKKLEREQNRRKLLLSQDLDLANPINRYLFLKNFPGANLFEQTQLVPAVENFNKFYGETEQIFVAREEDMIGAPVGLFRVQDTYNIYPFQISRDMTSDDCFYLGHVAISERRFDHALLWLLEAEKKLDSEPEDGIAFNTRQFNLTLFRDYLVYALTEQQNYEQAGLCTRENQNCSTKYTYQEYIDYYQQTLKLGNSSWDGRGENLPQISLFRLGNYFPQYEALCRGENTNTVILNIFTFVPGADYHLFSSSVKRGNKTLTGKNLLNCYYKRNSPFLKLAQIKVEMLHRNPDIFWFPDVLSDAEIDALLEVATPRLNRSLVINPDWQKENQDYEIKSEYRTSKLAGIDDSELNLAEVISKRVSDMTDLSMIEPESTEKIQVANYGIGGHSSPHYDMATVEEDMSDDNHIFGESGNRIGTMLFYNGAVFWYNLLKNGQPDLLTRHGGCPVLYGQKWIANKWLHERGQEFKRPCSLDPNQ